MSKNIEININTGDTYEALYPTTSMSNVTGTLPIANGGTNATSASSSVYNLTQPLSSRTAANLNSYASSTYIPCYYSTTGYKFPLSNIMTYINNNISAGAKVEKRNYYGTNTSSVTLPFSQGAKVLILLCPDIYTLVSPAAAGTFAPCIFLLGNNITSYENVAISSYKSGSSVQTNPRYLGFLDISCSETATSLTISHSKCYLTSIVNGTDMIDVPYFLNRDENYVYFTIS